MFRYLFEYFWLKRTGVGASCPDITGTGVELVQGCLYRPERPNDKVRVGGNSRGREIRLARINANDEVKGVSKESKGSFQRGTAATKGI